MRAPVDRYHAPVVIQFGELHQGPRRRHHLHPVHGPHQGDARNTVRHALSLQSRDLGIDGGKLLFLGHLRERSSRWSPAHLLDLLRSPGLEGRFFFRRHLGIKRPLRRVALRRRGLREPRVFLAQSSHEPDSREVRMAVRQARRRPAVGQRLRSRLSSSSIARRGWLPFILLSAGRYRNHADQRQHTRHNHQRISQM